ncbi:ABC transporter permease [bacterium]|nr:ABC transporter permease [bacterium]
MNNGFRWGRAFSIARKEIRHVMRDPFTLAWSLGLPLILVVFFGYAIDFNVRDVQLNIADGDKSRASRELLQQFSSSQYFRLKQVNPGQNVRRDLDQERSKGVLVIEPGFGRAVGEGVPASIQLLLDGADNSTVGIILSYVTGIQQATQEKLFGSSRSLPIKLKSRFLFNQEQSSQWFVVPGLVVIVVGLLSVLLTSLTVAREWETGSMELLLSTPVKPLEIILGKLTPYLVLVLIGVGMVYVIARAQFAIPFRGSHTLFIVGIILFLAQCLAQGLLISVITRQQQSAMMLAFITGLLPTLLLSGFIFPVESMPVFFQYFTYSLAPRWFMVVSRGLFLKGAGIFELAEPMIMLLVLTIITIVIALKYFKKDLEP